MNRTLFLLLAVFALLLSSCTRPQEPTFIGINNLVIEVADGKEIKVDGDALFHNPNSSGLYLKRADLELFMDGKKVGEYKEEMNQEIPANSDFSLPVKLVMPIEDIFSNPLDMLGGMLSVMGGKKFDLQYVGTVTVEVLGIELKVPLDHTDKVSLLDNKR